jgi:uncharacterized membrane protein
LEEECGRGKIMPDWVKNLPFQLIVAVLSALSFLLGIILIFKPELAIEIQRRFYAKINWRFEPISMPKEIRNTRIMGIILIGAAIAAVVFLILNPSQDLPSRIIIKNF